MRFLRLLGALALLASCLLAQTTTATLQGTIVDPGDAAIPGAEIKITNAATGAVRTAASSADGIFRFNSVVPGSYNVTIKSGQAFKAFAMNGLELNANDVRELGRLKLTLGSVTEEVSVTATATPVQTTSSENSKLVDGSQLSSITVRGRDVFAILQTIPGVSTGNTYLTQGSGETTSEGTLGSLSINGNAAGKINFQVDGISDMDTGSNTSTHFQPSMESIAEVRVLTANYQAEYGRNSGGQIAVVTKGGGQQFHGGASANKRHEMFNAKNFFTNFNGQAKPQYRFFIGSYNIGGPVYVPHVFNTQKNKVFFFWSQEYTRQKPAPKEGYANVPNANQRKGDFSYYPNSTGNFVANSLRNPTTGQFITPSVNAGTTGAQDFSRYLSSFDSQSQTVGQAMLNIMPLPNLCNAAAGTSDGNPWNGIAAGTGGSNLISPTNCPTSIQNPYLATGAIDAQGGPGTTNNNTRNYYWRALGEHPRRNDTIRLDFNLTSKVTSWARYIEDYDMDGNNFNMPLRDSTGAFKPTQVDHPNPGHGYGVGITYTLSPTMVNEFTFGKSYNSWSYYPHDDSQLSRSNMKNPAAFTNFTTDPNWVNDHDNARPGGLGSGSLFYMNLVPGVNYGSSTWTQTNFTANTCGFASCPYTNWNDIYSFNDSVSKVFGKHNMKAGLYYERTGKVENEITGNYLGLYNFAGGNALNQQDTLDGFANAYLGNINSYTEGAKRIKNSWFTGIEAFVQDNWRVSRRLTLDLGVRFYHLPPPQDLNKQYAVFVNQAYKAAAAERVYMPYCTVSTATGPCPNNTLTTKFQYAWDPAANPTASVGTGTGGAGNMYPSNLIGTLVPYSYNGLSTGYSSTPDPFTGMQVSNGNNPYLPDRSVYSTPGLSPAFRFGFAYDVFGNGKTALRGGFGQFLNRGSSGGTQSDVYVTNPPSAVTKSQNFGTIASIATSPLAGPNAANNLLIGLNPTATSRIIGKQKYEATYNGSLMVQQNIGLSSVLEVSWVFNLRRHTALTTNINAITQKYNELQPSELSPMTTYLDQYMPGNASGRALSANYFRPLQGYGALTEINFDGSANYHALQATLRRNLTKSISYGVAYTFSKTMSLVGGRSDIFPDKFRNWGPSYNPTPHVVAINYVYEVPKVAEKLGLKPLKWVTDGWRVSGLTQLRTNLMTGYPTVSWGQTNSTTLVAPNFTGTTAETARLNIVGDPRLASSLVSFNGGPTNVNVGVNGTPGNALINNAAFAIVNPCSLVKQTNVRTGVGMDMSCFGNAGAGSLLEIPGTKIDNWDMTFTKSFPIKGERRSLEFRAEMYNIFNHTQFAGAKTGQSYDWNNWKTNGVLVPLDGTTGRYTSAAQPRLMSMTLRLTF